MQLLKWAGSKSGSLQSYERIWPTEFRTLREVFAGSCAVYAWFKRSRRALGAVLTDANEEVINLLTVCRDRPEELASHIVDGRYRNTEFNYYEVRGLNPKSLSELERAARTLYLNRAGFNGLYRVSKSGHFNSPHGDGKWRPESSVAAIAEWAEILSGAKLAVEDFENAIDAAEPGDLVYADPPFLDQFVGYTAAKFGWGDYQRLDAAVSRAGERRVKVVISCPDDQRLIEMFAHLKLDRHAVERKIGGRRSSRQQTFELTFRNYSVGDES